MLNSMFILLRVAPATFARAAESLGQMTIVAQSRRNAAVSASFPPEILLMD